MRWLWVVMLAVVIVIGYMVKDWQCSEMFPTADRLACILWK